MSTPKLTKDQAAIVGLYTGITAGPFGDVHALAEKTLGRPIWTHQFAEQALWDELREKIKPDFLAICAAE